MNDVNPLRPELSSHTLREPRLAVRGYREGSTQRIPLDGSARIREQDRAAFLFSRSGLRQHGSSGLLPYQMCGAVGRAPAAVAPSTVRYSVAGTEHALLVLAASFWGESDRTGAPRSVQGVELLAYYTRTNAACDTWQVFRRARASGAAAPLSSAPPSATLGPAATPRHTATPPPPLRPRRD